MGLHISFTVVLTTLTLFLSLVPAIIIWIVFMDLLSASVDLLQDTTHSATDSVAQGSQSLMVTGAMDRLNGRLVEAENELQVQGAAIRVSGLLLYDLHPSRFDIPGRILAPFRTRNLETMEGHEGFTSVGLMGAIWPNGSAAALAMRTLAQVWSAMYVDVLTGAVGQRTLYYLQLAMPPPEQSLEGTLSAVDQSTGQPLATLQNYSYPAHHFDYHPSPSGWDTDLSFSQFTGCVELALWRWMPAKNDTWLQVTINVLAQTFSQQLAEALRGTPNNRLVVFFRQPHGHMVAASHGKFYSHSDVDCRFANPLANPPNLTTYRLWTCQESNDALIQLACQQLYSTYKAWTAIPALRTVTSLAGLQYWVAVNHSNCSMKYAVLMLTNRGDVMGPIDASSAAVGAELAAKKQVTFIVLGVVATVAVALPLTLGLWQAAQLRRLAEGMDQIAQLKFVVQHRPPSMFAELHRFQSSFLQLERGLQAFGKFVPQAVVKVLIAGKMHANNQMSNETLTIMFADIEGFSTICEAESPATLVAVCTEYFEAMCSNITRCSGTIDKFIGDCIMAMWNAPEPLPGHEIDAVEASLGMQASVMQLHRVWRRRRLPVLKFRLGIHTGVCLVGNFGCSYRVSYTCLGDGVNLAARLEALNKKFGTSICVSHSTFKGCRGRFRFRQLAKVTVPGKAEVLPVYEVLCPAFDDPFPVPALEEPCCPSLPSTQCLTDRQDSVEVIGVEAADSPTFSRPQRRSSVCALEQLPHVRRGSLVPVELSSQGRRGSLILTELSPQGRRGSLILPELSPQGKAGGLAVPVEPFLAGRRGSMVVSDLIRRSSEVVSDPDTPDYRLGSLPGMDLEVPLPKRTSLVPSDADTLEGRSVADPDRDAEDKVPYHWHYVSRAALLAQAAQYEAAYEALVSGNVVQARKLLLGLNRPSIPDKAWQSLTAQLQHICPSKPWDGIFYFREK
eukprot:EG_transcript_453